MARASKEAELIQSGQWGGLEATTNTEEGAKPALRVGVEGEAETVYGPGAEAASGVGVGAEPEPAAKTGVGAATETEDKTVNWACCCCWSWGKN